MNGRQDYHYYSEIICPNAVLPGILEYFIGIKAVFKKSAEGFAKLLCKCITGFHKLQREVLQILTKILQFLN
jgi:hypothetical protein